MTHQVTSSGKIMKMEIIPSHDFPVACINPTSMDKRRLSMAVGSLSLSW